jgi:hypothetical protein
MTIESFHPGYQPMRSGSTESIGDEQSPRAGITRAGRALRRLGRAWLRAQVRVAGPPWDGGRAAAGVRSGAGREGVSG